MRASRRAGAVARVAVAAVAVAALVALTGCAQSDASHGLVSPLRERFAAEQTAFDRLPPGSPALLTVAPGSSRLLGSTGVNHFYVAEGRVAPYCVIVMNIYAQQVAQHCGGDLFGGVLPDGRRFEFGAIWAPGIPGAESTWSLDSHLTVEELTRDLDELPLVRALLERPQSLRDLPPFAVESDRYDVDSLRLLATDGDRSYFIALSRWGWQAYCLFELSADVMSGSCAPGDVVIPSSVSIAHFSPTGFVGEVPDGWRQLSELLRVSESGVDHGGPGYPAGAD